MIREPLNEGWNFKRIGEETPGRAVTLPHDAMLEEPCSADSLGGVNTGWFAGRDYVYEKELFVPREWAGQVLYLEFEGVYRLSEVYVNDELAGGRPNGYIGFWVDVTSYIRFGETNVVRVVARNTDQPNSRWYSGAGIYRPVWLCRAFAAHVLPEGVRVTTLDSSEPTIRVEVRATAGGEAMIEVLDKGQKLASGMVGLEKRSADDDGGDNDSYLGSTVLRLAGAEAWDIESPKLYGLRVSFADDVCESVFGIRTLACDAESGFTLNGRRVILKGACVHHDNGLLGAAAHPFAERRKARLLKSAGYNAVRCSHNPCSKAFLDACDEVGLLVLEEYADMWYIHKTAHDYATSFDAWWERDLASIVGRDYNHPSVVMYSIGNEVSETAQAKGVSLCRKMTSLLHELDSTRPVTCGINIFFNYLSSLGLGVYSDKKAQKAASGRGKAQDVGSVFFNKLAGVMGAGFMKFGATLRGSDAKTRDAFAELDVAGYNYGIARYKRDLVRYPDRVILGTETFISDAAEFWALAQDHPALIGDFAWSGIDYLGEVGLGAWEYRDYAPDFNHGPGWIAAGVGAIDLTGAPTSQLAYSQVVFGDSTVRMAVVPADHAGEAHSPSAWRFTNARESWAWGGCEGKITFVEVYARAASVALLLNGREIGRSRVGGDCRVSFKVAWEPGVIEAVALDANGCQLGRASFSSVGAKTSLLLEPEDASVGETDLCYVRIRLADDSGLTKPLAKCRVQVNVDGGHLIALGNACPFNPDGYLGSSTATYFGEALAIVQPSGKGDIRVHATSPYGEADACVSFCSATHAFERCS